MKVHTCAELVLMSEDAEMDFVLPLDALLCTLGPQVKELEARCVHDPQASFPNNLGEQSMRMAKVQKKISGCLPTVAGVWRFSRLFSCASTLTKQDRHVLIQIANAIGGTSSIPLPGQAAG